jgi:hypothetical protein
MKLYANLSEFNRRFADALLPVFPAGVQALQSEDGTLLFRGPIPTADDPNHVGTHVAVSLDSDVKAALSEALPADREEMTEILISSLGTQVQMQYDPSKFSPFALDVVGKINILRGRNISQ